MVGGIIAVMFDTLRSLLARFIVQHLGRPRSLVVQPWLWLAAETDTLEEKPRCLKAVLQLDPDNEPESVSLLLLDQEQPSS